MPKRDAAIGDPSASAPTSDSSRQIRLVKSEVEKITKAMKTQEASIELNRNAAADIKKEISQIHVNIKDLLAIYEYVSQQFNPFNEEPTGETVPQAVPSVAEDELEAMSEPEPVSDMAQEVLVAPVTTTGPMAGMAAMGAPVAAQSEEPKPLLAMIPTNHHLTNVLVLRWMEFLLQRVRREHIPPLFDYYLSINWITEEVKHQLLAYIRGEVPDIVAYDPEPESHFHDSADELEHDYKHQRHLNYKVVDEWRLSADDHLKCYLFIQRIIGNTIDKNELNQIELEVRQIKGNLKSYYGL